jgi:hypothetical protein
MQARVRCERVGAYRVLEDFVVCGPARGLASLRSRLRLLFLTVLLQAQSHSAR